MKMTFISTISPEEFALNLCQNLAIKPLPKHVNPAKVTPAIYYLRSRIVNADYQILSGGSSLPDGYIKLVKELAKQGYSLDMSCPYVLKCLEQMKLNTLMKEIL